MNFIKNPYQNGEIAMPNISLESEIDYWKVASRKKTIGIIGGMGPLATVDLYKKIIISTKACKDSDHIHIIIDSYPQIPDRTSSILNNTESPVDYIVEAGNCLAQSGADFIIIPCNTSHFYYKEINNRINIPVLNMLDITAQWLALKGYYKVGILATDGTIHTGVYKNALDNYGINVIYPSTNQQKSVMQLIYGEIKAGKPINISSVTKIIEELKSKGAQRVVLGCTELPIALGKIEDDFLVDPTLLLAYAAVRFAGYETSCKVNEII